MTKNNKPTAKPDFVAAGRALANDNAKPIPELQVITGLDAAELMLVQKHPLYPVMCAAIAQAMWGKGERHGGDLVDFNTQPWAHYAKMHGRGFLTGQAAKKLEEAASTRHGLPFEQEVLGAIVYAGMAVIRERQAVGDTAGRDRHAPA
jgi:hypothetical protein